MLASEIEHQQDNQNIKRSTYLENHSFKWCFSFPPRKRYFRLHIFQNAVEKLG